MIFKVSAMALVNVLTGRTAPMEPNYDEELARAMAESATLCEQEELNRALDMPAAPPPLDVNIPFLPSLLPSFLHAPLSFLSFPSIIP
jgi:hypothetical protein